MPDSIDEENLVIQLGKTKQHKKKKKMSKKQKLLRQRFDSQKQKSTSADATDDVTVQYSVAYFSWAVSDNEDSEDEQVPNITLPLKSMKIN